MTTMDIVYETSTSRPPYYSFTNGEGGLMDATTYWCVGPEGRCSVGSPEYAESAPLFGDGNLTACGGCHVGLIFTKLQ